MLETEVYDILKVTLGYTSPGTNPYAKSRTEKLRMNMQLKQLNQSYQRKWCMLWSRIIKED